MCAQSQRQDICLKFSLFQLRDLSLADTRQTASTYKSPWLTGCLASDFLCSHIICSEKLEALSLLYLPPAVGDQWPSSFSWGLHSCYIEHGGQVASIPSAFWLLVQCFWVAFYCLISTLYVRSSLYSGNREAFLQYCGLTFCSIAILIDTG